MHRRPSGVTFSAVVLGVIDLFLLMGGMVYIMLAFLFLRSPQLSLSAANNAAPPPQQLIVSIMFFFALITLGCAAWGISTFVGLLRMRRWARISIMIIGGCLAALSLIELFGCVVMQFAMKNMPLPQNAGSPNLVATDPSMLTGVLVFMYVLCVAVAAIGIWWLVYFARRTTRVAFESTPLHTTLSSTAQLNPAVPITDFSVAQPVDAVQPIAMQPVAAVEAVPVLSGRPISMTIIAVLLFLSAGSMLLCCLLPYPLFFFGVQVSGASEYVVLISLAALYTLSGFGLLRRMHFGWLLAVGVDILALINLLTLLSPNVRGRYIAYLEHMSQSMTPVMPDATQASAQMLQQKMMAQMMVPMLGLGGVVVLFILMLLWRARWWYKSAA